MKKWLKRVSLCLSGALLVSGLNLGGFQVYAQTTVQEIYLSDLEWAAAQVNSEDAWAQPKKDVNCADMPIRMMDADGNVLAYAKGIALHANAELAYTLDGRYTRFCADVGTDYTNKEQGKPTSISCAVYADDETTPRWQAPAPITADTPLLPLELDVTGVQTLKLVVSDMNDGNDSDWSIWGDARLERNLSERELLDQAIAQAQALAADGYTDASWKQMQLALEAALTADGEEACLAARSALLEKMDALVTAYGILLEPAENGSLTAQPHTKAGAGDTVVIQALPSEGYCLYRLYVNGQDVTTSADEEGRVTIENVNGPVTARATFESLRLSAKYLSDIEWQSANTALGRVPARDANIGYSPLNVYGKTYDKGLGLHAGHEITYALDGAYQKLTALAAPDNGCNGEPGKNMSVMGLTVYADGSEIFRDDHIDFHQQEQLELDLDLRGVQELKLCATSGDNGNDWSDDLNLADAKLHYIGSELTGIHVNGQPLKEYLPSVYQYEVETDGAIPVVSARTLANASAQVTQATESDNSATIRIGGETYTITFQERAEFSEFSIPLPANQLLCGTGIIHANDVYVTIPEDMDKTALAPMFTAGNWGSVTVGGQPQQSGVTVQDFTTPVTYTVSNGTETRDYTVHVGTWRDIPKTFADETAGVLERPSVVNYPGTITMKMVLSVPVKGSATGSHVSARFDYALDVIRQVDNVTRGMPKVIYLVGWQYQGHDDKYPAWFEVNEHLKCTACEHVTALDCLKWLMDEAYEKYNTRVSLHLNSTDAYKDSPLWQTYVDNDLISKTLIGTLKKTGTWEGETAYQVNYTNEWEKGFYKQRVDQLLEMFDGRLQRAGTIHSDAFFCRSSKQSNVRTEQEARVRMIRYWRDCGVDLTTEFLHNGNEKTAGGDGSGLLGVCPMTWHFNQSIESYMTRPASMVTGGGINDIDYGDDKETVEILFGRNMWGEDLLTTREKYGLDYNPTWAEQFRAQFCTQTLPYAYQNLFDRLRLENNVVVYSDGLVANANNRMVFRDGRLIRENDDVFVPAVWKENEVIAYSAAGYVHKTWRFQKEFTATAVDVYSIDKTGATLIASNLDVSGGQITLSLQANQMVSIVPAGSAI